MSIKKTRIIYLIFILIFFVSAPLILSYASGWRYDFKRKKITKTGSISLSSFPAGAKVYLNDKLQKQGIFRKILFYKTLLNTRKIGGLTPTLIKNLVPDEYTIKIKKDNYQIWEKKLNIEKEKTIIIKNIDLFLKQPKIKLLTDKNIIDQKISPDQEKIIYITKNENNFNLEIIDLKSEKTTVLYQSQLQQSLIEWSPSGENILIKEIKSTANSQQTDENYLIVPLDGSKIILSLKNFLPINKIFTNLKWKNNLIIFGISEKNLYQINIPRKTYQVLTKLNNNDYLIKGNDLYQLKNVGDQTHLEKTSLSSKEQILITALPYSDSYKFVNLSSNIIGLKNEKNNLFFLIDPLIKEGGYLINKNIILKNKVDNWQIENTSNQFLYNNDFEISIFNLEKMEQEIITRYSQEIKKAVFYHLGYSIIFNTENSIYAVEIDKRDKRNFIELINFKKIDDFFISNTPKILYLIGEKDNKKGLFKIQVQ